jgi:hypothetical protein
MHAGGTAFRPELNVYRTLAHHPAVLVAWVSFGRTVADSAWMSPRERERIILHTAAKFDSRYAWARHARLAHKAGIGHDEVSRTWTERAPGLPTSDEPFARLGAHQHPLVVFYAAASFVLNALEVPPDDDLHDQWAESIDPPGSSRAQWPATMRRLGYAFIAETSDRDRPSPPPSRSTGDPSRAFDALCQALVGHRGLAVSDWNGVIRVVLGMMGDEKPSRLQLAGPSNTSGIAARLVATAMIGAERTSDVLARAGHPVAESQLVEAMVLAALTGIDAVGVFPGSRPI